MKLTKKAIEAINNKTMRLKLALALDFTEQWIIKVIDTNKDNGPLTTGGAISVIRQETGMEFEEILESETVEQN